MSSQSNRCILLCYSNRWIAACITVPSSATASFCDAGMVGGSFVKTLERSKKSQRPENSHNATTLTMAPLRWLLLAVAAVPAASLAAPYGALPRNRGTDTMVSMRCKQNKGKLGAPSHKPVVPSFQSGSGPVQVDLNQYNLPLDRIEEEWECHMYATTGKSAEEGSGVRLQCKSNDVFVDTVTVKFPRQQASLGLELLELAGGRKDGLGITVVNGIVEGGPAEGCDIQIGDSISQVSVLQSKSMSETKGLVDVEQVFSVPTEALDYDATVKALHTLPPLQDGQEIQLKLRRLRRRPVVTINLQFPPSQNEPDATIQLFAGENLRQGMLVRGVKLNDALAKRFDTKNGGNCGAGGLCRTCAVSVSRGQELLNPQRIAEQQMLQDAPRWRLACKAIVGYGMTEGEISLRVSPNQW